MAKKQPTKQELIDYIEKMLDVAEENDVEEQLCGEAIAILNEGRDLLQLPRRVRCLIELRGEIKEEASTERSLNNKIIRELVVQDGSTGQWSKIECDLDIVGFEES